MTRERSAQLRDDRTAIILWCWIDGQKLTEICRSINRCTTSVNRQIAQFIEEKTGCSVDRIYGAERKKLGLRALSEYRKARHNIHLTT